MIKVAIVGYGNLGRGVERALKQAPDMTLVGVYTRRAPEQVTTEGAPAYSMAELLEQQGEIDVCILCGGSATDLPVQTPELAQYFNLVDSFDTHAKIPEHFAKVDQAAKSHQKVAVISSGWDPGLFSLQRLYAESILPQGRTETFWGKGVSQGHSDALRRIEGVVAGVQYTIPNEEMMNRLRAGEELTLTARDKHFRQCFVVTAEGADQAAIRQQIVTMPNYFADYETEVNFISQAELAADHQGMPHGGTVLHTGTTHEGTPHRIEYSLELGDNPEFTSSVLVAYARAAHKLAQEQTYGATTVLEIAPSYLSPKSIETLRQELL